MEMYCKVRHAPCAAGINPWCKQTWWLCCAVVVVQCLQLVMAACGLLTKGQPAAACKMQVKQRLLGCPHAMLVAFCCIPACSLCCHGCTLVCYSLCRSLTAFKHQLRLCHDHSMAALCHSMRVSSCMVRTEEGEQSRAACVACSLALGRDR
jgi:hypothetical protein